MLLWLLKKAVWNCTCATIVAAPAVCFLADYTWRHVELPFNDGVLGNWIAVRLKLSIFASFCLLGAFAYRSGSLIRCVWAFYLTAGATILVQRILNSHVMKRSVRIGVAFWPSICWYHILKQWTKRAHLSEEQLTQAWKPFHDTVSKRVVEAMIDLGGLFVKLGQLASLFSPALGLPAEYARELKRLQNEVTPMAADQVRAIVTRELGQPLQEVFSFFEDTPLGSASMGQVHHARLASNGLDVAVKVQYPDVARDLELDLAWMRCLINRLNPPQEGLDQFDQFREAMFRELDYTSEAQSLDRVHASMRTAFPDMNVPAPISEHCRPALLVMTLVPGVSVLDALMRSMQLLAQITGHKMEDMYEKASKAIRNMKDNGEVENAFVEQGNDNQGVPASSTAVVPPAFPHQDARFEESDQLDLPSKSAAAAPPALPRQDGKRQENDKGPQSSSTDAASPAVPQQGEKLQENSNQGLSAKSAAAATARLPQKHVEAVARQKPSQSRQLLAFLTKLLPKISHATKLKLFVRFASLRLRFQNAAIALYNNSLGRCGATLVPYRSTIPKFNPVDVSKQIWMVQGHQLFVDGFFNTDSHPGNYLIDERTGRLGLIDFGQVCEVCLETRVRFARLVLALTKGVPEEIAQKAAQMGLRTKKMRSEQLILHARKRFGKIAYKQVEEIDARLKVLDKADPLVLRGDSKVPLIVKMIGQLRGTNVFLGVLGKHNVQSLWVGYAEAMIRDYGAQFPEERVQLDLDI